MKLQYTLPQNDQVKILSVRLRENIPEVVDEICTKY